MSLNRRCPRCGGTNVQLTQETSDHGCFWLLFLGWEYLLWVLIKWIIGIVILVCLDWWLAIIFACCGKGYPWLCRRFFTGKTRYYYCYDCGNNFCV